MRVEFVRSEEWRTEQTIENGENEPRDEWFTVGFSHLSPECRRAIVESCGKIPESLRMHHGRYFHVDGFFADESQELAKAFEDCFMGIQKQAEEKQEADRIREQAEVAKEAEKESARELLADEIGDLNRLIEHTKQESEDRLRAVKVLVQILMAVDYDSREAAIQSVLEKEISNDQQKRREEMKDEINKATYCPDI